MQRVIGMDIHRTFAEVVFWGGRPASAARADRYDPLGGALTLVWPFPAREAEPSGADFYFGNSVGGAGAAAEQWGRLRQHPPIATAWTSDS
jgi:hypothetical protein